MSEIHRISFKDILMWGINPKPEIQIPILVTSTADAVVNGVLLFTERKLPPQGSFEWMNHFGTWIGLSGAYKIKLIQHIQDTYTNLHKGNASRYIESIYVSIFNGLPLSRFSLLFDLGITVVTHLGDGAAVFTEMRTWEFTQRKGRYSHISHFLLRHRKM